MCTGVVSRVSEHGKERKRDKTVNDIIVNYQIHM